MQQSMRHIGMELRKCLLVFFCFVVRVLIAGLWTSLGLFFIEFQEYFSVSIIETSLVGSVYTTIVWTSSIIASALSHRFSFRTITITGGTIASTALLLTAVFAHSIQHIVCAFAFTGFGLGIALLAVQGVIVFNFDKQIGIANGLTNAGVGIGLFAIPPLVQLLIENFGWRGGTLILSAIYANISACGSILKPTESEIQMRKRHKHHKDSSKTDKTDLGYVEDSKGQNTKRSTRTFSKFKKSFDFSLFSTNPNFIGLFVCGLFTGIGYTSVIIYIAPKAVDEGMSKLNASYIMSIIGICQVLGRILAGVIVDRQHTLKSSIICGITTALSGATTFLYPIGNSFAFLASASVLFGVSSGFFNCLHLLVGKEYVGVNQASGAFAWFQVAWALGSFAGIYMQAYLYDTTGSYLTSFAVAGTFQILAGLSLLIGPCVKTGNRLLKRRHERIGEDDKPDKDTKLYPKDSIVMRKMNYEMIKDSMTV
ncbi:monocarboxylate transporter 12-like [Amphiura filiformis]|uniref:monocarboxylate transporter 12-like n=1 Tax=Amphiura filiformis TaxID=82378 RepID=UPI003B215531